MTAILIKDIEAFNEWMADEGHSALPKVEAAFYAGIRHARQQALSTEPVPSNSLVPPNRTLSHNEAIVWAALNRACNPLTTQAELWILMEHPLALVRFAALTNPSSPSMKLAQVKDQDVNECIRVSAHATLAARPEESNPPVVKHHEHVD